MKRRKRAGGVMHLLWMSWLLIAAMLASLDSVSGEAGEVWSSDRFPYEELGPDNWRYYRVELPPMFSLLTVSLTRHWPHDNNASATSATVPLVCFGFCGPPLSMPPRKSLLEAAIAAGASQNMSATGECGWFNDTVVVNVTNVEVLSGTLHIGIFSDPEPTRTQSKMIPRGKQYKFGLDIQVFWCGTEALAGIECNLQISPLVPHVFLKSLYRMHTLPHDEQPFLSSRSSRSHFKDELGAQSCDDLNSDHATLAEPESSSAQYGLRQQLQLKDKELINLRNQKQDEFLTKALNSGWSDWISSSQQCIRLNDKQFFSLQVVDFVQELEIKYDCISNVSYGVSKCEEFESMVKEGRIPLLHLRYGALPGKDTSDFRGEPSTGSIVVLEPKRGWWYVAIFNPMVTSNQVAKGMGMLAAEDGICLTLNWRTKTCGPSLTGNDCQWPVDFLERILTKPVQSPFDSFYHPASKSDSLDHHTRWFSLGSLSNASAFNVTVEQWGYAIIKVANGAAGAVLSVDVQTSLPAHTELYARHEGCPTNSNWDFQVTKENTQRLSRYGGEPGGLGKEEEGSQILKASKYESLSLPVVYPMEGYWCVGLRYVPHLTNIQSTVVENSSVPNRQGAPHPVGGWILRWKLYFICYEGKLSFLKKVFSSGGTSAMCNGISVDSLDVEHKIISSGERMQLRVTLHGCANQCSGHGSCLTAYEASHLHFISYCHCDVTHGDFDCSMTLLQPWKDLRQRFLLIFSNGAAILPSIWALRHQAYSEWITFTLSGIASGIYHSCDAGGWCAMSYSTLQFLDFWLSFVVIIMTCLLLAGFAGPTKAVLHIGCAVLTAAVAKEDATSGWSILVVVLISSAGLLLGWGLETQRISSLRLWLPTSPNRTNVASCIQLCQRLVRSFYMQLRDRFQWPYLWLGLAFLLSALWSNRMELPETYWIWHSWWHISIYICAFILLYSIKAVDGTATRQGGDLNEYQSVPLAQRQEDSITDSHDDLVLELNSFPDSHTQ